MGRPRAVPRSLVTRTLSVVNFHLSYRFSWAKVLRCPRRLTRVRSSPLKHWYRSSPYLYSNSAIVHYKHKMCYYNKRVFARAGCWHRLVGGWRAMLWGTGATLGLFVPSGRGPGGQVETQAGITYLAQKCTRVHIFNIFN